MSQKLYKKIEIIHEDEHLVAVNKPPGILSIPDRFRKELPSVSAYLSTHFEDIFTIHRLDRDTSGVLLFARDEDSHRTLSMAFQDRKVQKYYQALVNGKPLKDQDMMDYPITESHTEKGKYIIHRNGKPSQTSYTILQNWRYFSHVELELHTGRTHQIRVHLNHIGHPLIVDDIYGNRSEFFLSEIKGKKYRRSRDEEERPLLTRQPLHASRLIIPWKDKMLTFSADIPKDMRAVISQLNKIYKDDV